MGRVPHREFDCAPGCPVEGTLRKIGGKWKGTILFLLLKENVRFNAFQRKLPTVTQKVLTNQLRELEADGLIGRKIYAEVPPRVEYFLLPLGRTLEPVILSLWHWGENYLQRTVADTQDNISETQEGTESKEPHGMLSIPIL
ncbi:MAG: helix-turn-helix transcriptional regulator [Sulfuricellaceae bacterium]|nr:helix-turn-helix transcriptional regulator [Sulfuricellaceae bacterium]